MSILTLYKPKDMFEALVTTEIPNNFYDDSFFYTYVCILYIVWYINIRMYVEYYDCIQN